MIHIQCNKIIHRHPHVYSDEKVRDENDVKQNWEELKLKEGTTSVLDGVPKGLPSMIKAIRIQEKARGVGFDWEKPEQVWDKVIEEMEEFLHEARQGNQKKSEEEFGDLIFALINYARFKNINPEEALERTNIKFIKRFQYLEKSALAAGRQLSDMTLDEMDVYWNEAKKKTG